MEFFSCHLAELEVFCVKSSPLEQKESWATTTILWKDSGSQPKEQSFGIFQFWGEKKAGSNL
jgi:hypothetical protein